MLLDIYYIFNCFFVEFSIELLLPVSKYLIILRMNILYVTVIVIRPHNDQGKYFLRIKTLPPSSNAIAYRTVFAKYCSSKTIDVRRQPKEKLTLAHFNISTHCTS